MGRYHLCVIDSETADVVRELYTDILVFSYLEIDEDGDIGAGHSTLCSSCGPNLIGVLAASVRYAKVSAKEVFDDYMKSEEENS